MEVILWIIVLGGCSALAFLIYAYRQPPAWRASERGNLTTLYRGKRVTIFPSDSGQLWKFCIADPLDRTEPIYSEWYDSHETARSEAMSLITTGRISAKTYRERKEEGLREQAPAILDGAIKKLDEMEKAVSRLDKLKAPTSEQFDRASERLSKALRSTQHAHHTLIGCDANTDLIDRASKIPLAVIDLKDRLAEIRSRRLPG